MDKGNMLIWAKAYRPFVMGGSVHYFAGFETEVGEPIQLDGVQVVVVVSPDGAKQVVAEAETGAIVGTNLEEVKQDIATGDKEQTVKNIEWARGVVASGEIERLPAWEFWKKR